MIKANYKEYQLNGVKKNPYDPRDIYVKSFNITAKKELPTEYIYEDIDLIPILNQQSLGSCLSQAEAICKSIQDYEETKKSGKKNFELLSVQHLASLIEQIENDGEGAYPRNAGKVLKDTGIATEKVYPTDNTLTWAEFTKLKEGEEIKQSADKHKVKSYTFIPRNLEIIKSAIIDNKVVGITLPMLNWEHGWSNGILVTPSPLSEITGYHRVYLYGYKDINNDTIFYFVNSWGKEWGNNGRGEFRWSDYNNIIWDIMTYFDLPEEEVKKLTQLKYSWDKDLYLGKRDEDVRVLQIALKELGFLSIKNTTDYFGTKTLKAVIAFQKAHNIFPAIGYVGKRTRTKLNQIFK